MRIFTMLALLGAVVATGLTISPAASGQNVAEQLSEEIAEGVNRETNSNSRQQSIGGESPRLAIQGYSPVSYFEEGRAEMGLPEFTAVHDGRTYRFTDAEQEAKFEADPETYAPLFPNHCPYNLALGRKAKIDPTNFKIVGDDLLLFHRSEEMDGLEKWNEADDEQELLRRAESNYTLFEF